MPHRDRFQSDAELESFIEEARRLAGEEDTPRPAAIEASGLYLAGVGYGEATTHTAS